MLVAPFSININISELLRTPWVGTFFPVKMCDRLCFWFLCKYQQLLEISWANHVTVHVVGQSKRQLSPLTLTVRSTELKKIKKIPAQVLAGLVHKIVHSLHGFQGNLEMYYMFKNKDHYKRS